jgi:alcohol dehydrogenase
MRAAIFDAYRAPLRVASVPDPETPDDGVTIRVLACGICRSDWHGWVGADPDVRPPHVPGHEFAGVVESVGSECNRWRPGALVTAPFIIACGGCPVCRAGEPTVCPHQYLPGFSGWGAFAELVAIPHADFNITALPEGMEPIEASAMGCRLTTAFRGLVDRAALAPGEWLAVHGCGGVGLSAVMLGAALGARVIAVDIREDKLAFARQLGAVISVNARESRSAAEEIVDVTEGGAHVAVDALGVTETMRSSILSLRPLGRHVQIGMPAGSHVAPQLPMEVVYRRQLTLLGSRGMAARSFGALLEMIAEKRIDPARLITRRVTLERAGEVLAGMDRFEELGIAVIDQRPADAGTRSGSRRVGG